MARKFSISRAPRMTSRGKVRSGAAGIGLSLEADGLEGVMEILSYMGDIIGADLSAELHAKKRTDTEFSNAQIKEELVDAGRDFFGPNAEDEAAIAEDFTAKVRADLERMARKVYKDTRTAKTGWESFTKKFGKRGQLGYISGQKLVTRYSGGRDVSGGSIKSIIAARAAGGGDAQKLARQTAANGLRAGMKNWMRRVSDRMDKQVTADGGRPTPLKQGQERADFRFGNRAGYPEWRLKKFGVPVNVVGKASGQLYDNLQPDVSSIRIVSSKRVSFLSQVGSALGFKI